MSTTVAARRTFRPATSAIADVYARFLAVALDEPAICALVTWGLCDPYSWYNSTWWHQYARPDNVPQRPLLFDAEFRPKLSFFAVLNALKHAPKRPAAAQARIARP